MLPEDFAANLPQRLHAALDQVVLPDRDWQAGRTDLAARVRRRRTRAAVAAAAATVLVMAGAAVMAVSLSAGHRGDGHRSAAATLLRFRKTASVSLVGLPPRLTYGGGRLFATTDQGRLLRLDPVSLKITGRLFVGRLAAPTGPMPVAYGDHAVWVLNLTRRQLWRVDPASLRVTLRLPVGPASELAYGGGSVWLTTCCVPAGRGEVLRLDRIDPATGQRTGSVSLPGIGRHGWGVGLPARFGAPTGLPPVALAAGRVILVAGPYAPVSAISPVTMSVLRRFRVGCDGCEGPLGVAVGPDGLYATSVNNVVRLDLATGRVVAEGPPSGLGLAPGSLTPIVASPGGVWLLTEGQACGYVGTVALLDPHTLAVNSRTNIAAIDSVLAIGPVVYATTCQGMVRFQRTGQ